MLHAEIDKTFKSGARVTATLDLSAGPSVTVLFGPSGAGKTTLLRCIAGLEELTAGRIVFKDQIWADAAQRRHLPTQKRAIGYLFQDYALFPHLKVRDNIGFGIHELSLSDRSERIMRTATSLQIGDLLDRWPSELSGGQQQRAALARVLVREPELLLLDEPLSALDGVARDHVRGELAQLLRRLQMPAIVVTHDWVDALSLGNRLHVMSRGIVLQEGTPQEVFARPQHAEVAAAVGMENLVKGHVKERGDGVVRLQVGRAELYAPDPQRDHAEFFVCIRGENVMLETGTRGQSSARNHLSGKVVEIASAGSLLKVTVDVGFEIAALVTRQAVADMRLEHGAEVAAVFKASAVHLIPASD
ncbi:MAG TPA: ABC transporter ATP-binding protein [Terriglobia bacterium]|nr:ABC transporter ATP-binding protein [Terriglobia bacterium]